MCLLMASMLVPYPPAIAALPSNPFRRQALHPTPMPAPAPAHVQFDKCMTCVEDLDRPEPTDFKQEVRNRRWLWLR